MSIPLADSQNDGGLNNVWVHYDSSALTQNARAVVDYINPQGASKPGLMAVVKANGYGHGAANAALAFRLGGASWFGVTSLEEASELIQAGIDSRTTPILVFTPPVNRAQCVAMQNAGLHITVCSKEQLRLAAAAADSLGIKANVHLKIDTGMGRLGLTTTEAMEVAREIVNSPSAQLVAVYTHFATAFEENLSFATRQLKNYKEFCDTLREQTSIRFLQHCANSAALLRLPDSWFDLVRAGTLLYGQYPSSYGPNIVGLLADTLALEARVVFVHALSPGATVGYGAEFTARRLTRAAVLPVGFADGVGMAPESLTSGMRGLRTLVGRLLRPKTPTVKFGSFRAPIIGRVAMQMTVVDVTDSPVLVNAGDVAVVPVRRLAISSRIPRIDRSAGASQ